VGGVVMKFLDLDAVKKLKDLAQNPPNLTDETFFNAERISSCIAEGASLKLLYAQERVSDEILEALFELSVETECLEKMKKMQSGEIVNEILGAESEKREALHTAMRDFFSPNNEKKALEAKNLAKLELDKLKAFCEKKAHLFEEIVMIGIGGSNLGPEAHYLALKHLKKKNVFFIGNVDPDEAALVLREISLKKTLVLVVSKSGSTLETATNEAFLKRAFEKEGLDPKEHFVAITAKGSPLDDPKKYLESFYIWDFVGGRYSTTSMVGGVLLSLAFGFPVFYEFLRGASSMDKIALSSDRKKNLPLLGALLGVWNRNFLCCETEAIIPYSQALSRFPAHVQQLTMESNGKSIDKNGHPVNFLTSPIIWGEPGTNAQHSFYQLIHQGTDVVPVEMIGFVKSQCEEDIAFLATTSQQKLLANLFAQAVGLAIGQKSENPNRVFRGNRVSRILLGEQLNPYTLGALLSYYEHKTVFQGFIWNINSFDQEGVQLGKKLASEMIEGFQGKKSSPLVEAYLKQVSSMSEK
jgi:glucose-6-phosphate isomerase